MHAVVVEDEDEACSTSPTSATTASSTIRLRRWSCRGRRPAGLYGLRGGERGIRDGRAVTPGRRIHGGRQKAHGGLTPQPPGHQPCVPCLQSTSAGRLRTSPPTML